MIHLPRNRNLPLWKYRNNFKRHKHNYFQILNYDHQILWSFFSEDRQSPCDHQKKIANHDQKIGSGSCFGSNPGSMVLVLPLFTSVFEQLSATK